MVEVDSGIGSGGRRSELFHDAAAQPSVVQRVEIVRPFAHQHEEHGEEHHGDAHVQAEGMDVGVDFARVEFGSQEAGAGEEVPQGAPYFGVELVDILEVLAHVLPERLFHVERILAAAVAVHTFKRRTAVFAMRVFRRFFLAYPLQAEQFYLATHASGAGFPTFFPVL